MGALQNWLQWSGWKLFCGLGLLLCLIAIWLSWLAIPDYHSIAHLRVVHGGKAVVEIELPGRPGEDKIIYAPAHGGRIDVTMGENRVLGAIPEVAGAQLTHDRRFGVMVIPAELTQAETLPVRLSLRDDYRGLGMGAIYVGPRIKVEAVVDQQRRYGRLMQLVLPVAALITIVISTLLIFFSRRPRKYMYLILGFTLQLLVELADEPVLAFLNLDKVMPLLSLTVNAFIALAIAAWTGAGNRARNMIAGSCAAVFAVLTMVRLTGSVDVPVVNLVAGTLFVGWIVGIQLFDWIMIIRARHVDSRVRTASLAVFFLGCSGLLSFQALYSTRPDIVVATLISNYVNIASAMAVLIFAFGSLISEMVSYRNQARQVGSLETIVSGHHLALDDQAAALKREIEHGAVMEERQRFLQDMHDGLGGQLLTLLLRLRKAGGAAAPLANDVQAIIGDLRLMTSMLDDDGVSLLTALEQLRGRIDRQCVYANMSLVWKDDLKPYIDLQAGTVVHVLRMIEEAATNAVRHSQGRTLQIFIAMDDCLMIEISDDGRGFDRAEVAAGAGLRGIEQRAAKLGGSVQIERLAFDAGVKLSISIPIGKFSQTGPATLVAAPHEWLHSSN